jgi:transcriptional regulator with XRE-family HTH domain
LIKFILFANIALEVKFSCTTILPKLYLYDKWKNNQRKYQKITHQTWPNSRRFSQKADIKYTTLMKVESGVVNKPSVQTMAKIAKAIGVSIEDLIK